MIGTSVAWSRKNGSLFLVGFTVLPFGLEKKLGESAAYGGLAAALPGLLDLSCGVSGHLYYLRASTDDTPAHILHPVKALDFLGFWG